MKWPKKCRLGCLLLALLLATPALRADEPIADTVPTQILRKMERGWRRRNLRIYERNNPIVGTAFRDVVSTARLSTARVLCDGVPTALGTIVDSAGYVLTKSSELHGHVECELLDRRRVPATFVAGNRDYDLALLRIEADDLTPIVWSTTQPAVGAWLASAGLKTDPKAIGVLSSTARAIQAPIGALGVELEQTAEGARITGIIEGSPAEKIGLEAGDVVTRVNKKAIRDIRTLSRTIGSYKPGDRVRISVRRNGSVWSDTAILCDKWRLRHSDEQAEIMESLAGPLSNRRRGFPSAMQHDTPLKPHDCGGPLVDLDGHAVGINIARSSRVATYAIPAVVVRKLLPELVAQDAGYHAATTQVGAED